MHTCDDEKCEKKGLNKFNLANRIGAMVLAVASVLLMASACQCTLYGGQYGEPGHTATCSTYFPYGEPEHTVTFSDFAPYLYLVVANAIAAGLEALATVLSIWKKGADALSKLLLPFLDTAVPALLYSSTGAVFAAGDITYCSAYGRRVSVCAGSTSNFCTHVHMSMYVALAAAVTVSVAEVAKSLSPGGHKPDKCCEDKCCDDKCCDDKCCKDKCCDDKCCKDKCCESGCGHGCKH